MLKGIVVLASDEYFSLYLGETGEMNLSQNTEPVS